MARTKYTRNIQPRKAVALFSYLINVFGFGMFVSIFSQNLRQALLSCWLSYVVLSGRVTVGALKWSHKCSECTRPTLHAAVEVEAGHRFEESVVKAVLISPAELQAFADHMRDKSLPYFLATPERLSRSVAHCSTHKLDHKH